MSLQLEDLREHRRNAGQFNEASKAEQIHRNRQEPKHTRATGPKIWRNTSNLNRDSAGRQIRERMEHQHHAKTARHGSRQGPP